MIVNGFNSDDYRYFYVNEDIKWNTSLDEIYFIKKGNIIKIPNSVLFYKLFNNNFYSRVKKNLKDFTLIPYPTDKPFDLFEFLQIQNPLIFDRTYKLNLIFEYGEYCLIDEWFKEKLEDSTLTKFINGTSSIRENNIYELNALYDEEFLYVAGKEKILLGDNLNNMLDLVKKPLFNGFKSNGQTVRLAVPYYEGEKWYLTNISIALALLNQDFVKLLLNSTEILGKEKENIFYNEYKDNLQNSNIRYYKIKNNVKVHDYRKLFAEHLDENIVDGYEYYLVNSLGKILFCEHNENNFNQDGSIKIIAVKYFNCCTNTLVEKEIFKIADRLEYKEAVKKYEEDLKAQAYFEKQKEAEKYVLEHQNRYNKGTNRLLTPLEFMENEQRKEREHLDKRLIKTLYKRMEILSKKEK